MDRNTFKKVASTGSNAETVNSGGSSTVSTVAPAASSSTVTSVVSSSTVTSVVSSTTVSGAPAQNSTEIAEELMLKLAPFFSGSVGATNSTAIDDYIKWIQQLTAANQQLTETNSQLTTQLTAANSASALSISGAGSVSAETGSDEFARKVAKEFAALIPNVPNSGGSSSPNGSSFEIKTPECSVKKLNLINAAIKPHLKTITLYSQFFHGEQAKDHIDKLIGIKNQAVSDLSNAITKLKDNHSLDETDKRINEKELKTEQKNILIGIKNQAVSDLSNAITKLKDNHSLDETDKRINEKELKTEQKNIKDDIKGIKSVQNGDFLQKNHLSIEQKLKQDIKKIVLAPEKIKEYKEICASKLCFDEDESKAIQGFCGVLEYREYLASLEIKASGVSAVHDDGL